MESTETERTNRALEREQYDVRLFLVIDDGSGEGSFFALARDEDHAKELARPVLVGDSEEEDLRVVTAETTTNARTRELLRFWGGIARQALKNYHPRVVMDELNSLEATADAVADALATARAEAALAERNACVAALQAMIEQFDSERAKCQQGSQLWFDRLAQTTALMIARTAIAARSNGGAP